MSQGSHGRSHRSPQLGQVQPATAVHRHHDRCRYGTETRLARVSTRKLVRNLMGYAGYSFSTIDVMSMMWGTFSASKKPRIFFPPTVSCVDLERAMTMLLLLRAVERIRCTLLEGLSGVPAVNDPSSSTIPFLTVTASSSWTQRST